MSRRLPLLMALWALAGCDAGGEDSAGAAFVGDAGLCVADDDCAEGALCFDGRCVFQGAGGPDAPGEGEPPPAPPEVEETLDPGLRPAAGLSRVWVASPETDRVAAIDGAALTVAVTAVGDEPTAVAVRAGSDVAVVLCRGSDEAIVVDPAAPGLVTYRLPGHFNALDIGPAGRYAYVWFDLSDVRPGEDAAAVQDVVVIDLDEGRQHPVTIGFAPQAVQFAEDGTALFITDDGISIIAPGRLDGPAVALTVPTAPDVFRLADREVALTADGRYAASRGPGERGITVVDLAEGIPRVIDLGAEPTDLDLLPAAADRPPTALVMLREARQLALVPLAGDDPVRFIDLGGRPLGSAAVSPRGDRAVLYATRPDHAPSAALLALPGGEVIDVPLRKRARVGAIDPSGSVAWILHGPEPETAPLAERPAPPPPADAGPPEDGGLDDAGLDAGLPADAALEDAALEDAALADAALADAAADAGPTPTRAVVDPALADRHGYSLVDLRTGFVKLQITPAEPFGLTFAPGAAFVALPRVDGAGPGVQRIDLARFDNRTWPLGSAPESLGVLPAVGRAFVTQDHPTGRISFVPLDADGRIQTLTGYALDGRIE